MFSLQPPVSLAPVLPSTISHHVTFLCASSDVTFVDDVIKQLAQPSLDFICQKLVATNSGSIELQRFGQDVLQLERTPSGVRTLSLVIVMSRCLIANVSCDTRGSSIDVAVERATEALQPKRTVILLLNDTCQLPPRLRHVTVVSVTSPNWWATLVCNLCTEGINDMFRNCLRKAQLKLQLAVFTTYCF